jgi:hypothetical protein
MLVHHTFPVIETVLRARRHVDLMHTASALCRR